MFQYFFLFYWWILLYGCTTFYLFIGWWTVRLFPLFWLFWIMLLWTLMYKFLCEYIFTFLWGVYQIIVLCWIIWGAAKLFSKVSVAFFYIYIFPPVVYVACNFSISLPTLVTIYPFNYSHRSECDVVSYFNLICISLMTNIVEHLSLWLFNSGQLLSCVQLFATPWTAARQTSLSITNSRKLPKPMSIESMMPYSHLILCCPLLLLPSVFPSIRVFSSESALRMRLPKYWSFSFNISPSNEHPRLISFRTDWLNLLAVQGTLKSLFQHHSSKASILRRSAFFILPTLMSIHDHWKNCSLD